MRYILFTIVFSICLFSFALKSQSLPDGFILEVFVDDILQPTQLCEAPDGRVFVAERTGKIRIIENGVLLSEPFYQVETETPGERGITGLILHPEFDQNGYMYVYHTIPDTNRNRLIRVQASGNTASPDSEEEIFLLDPMWAAWHNGGGMAFDNDGYLFLGVGDGTAWQSAEQTGSTLGKVLRLHDDGTIPVDNPFYDELEEDQKAIWGIGIRNPYTMAKQNSTGRIFFNDVGNSEWEEVNEVIEGAHYGWGSIEGPIQAGQTAPDGYEDPIHAYNHDFGCAIVGATFYEPNSYLFPEDYHHQFFFMEHCQGKVLTLDPSDGSVSEFINGLQFPNNILTLRDGSILITEIFNNRILKVRYTGNGLPGIVEHPQSQVSVIGEDASFVVLTLGQEEFEYQWFLNGLPMDGENEYSLILSEVSLSMDGNNYHCEVSNAEGSAVSQTAELTVLDETRPEVEILLPIEGSLYSAGDTIWFSGQGVDSEDGELTPANLEWNIFFHHNVHQHTALTGLTGVSESYFVIPLQGEVSTDVWYGISLKAIDSAGLVSTETIDIFPELVEFQISSVPSGAYFIVDGSKKESGETIESVKNMTRVILAEEYLVQDQSLYAFKEWSESENETTVAIQAIDTTLLPEYDFLHEYFEGQDTEDVFAQYYTGIGEQRQLFVEAEVNLIDENWNLQGPYQEEGFPEDNFSVTYTGSILAPYSGDYTLSILHDGEVNFTLEDSLIISYDSGTLITSSQFVTDLEGGVRYNFNLDYQHSIDFSRLNLSWKFSELPELTIPSKQLYAPYSLAVGSSYLDELRVYPNPSSGRSFIDFGEFQYTWIRDNGKIELFNGKGEFLKELDTGSYGSSINLNDLAAGEYYIKLVIPDGERTIKMILMN